MNSQDKHDLNDEELIELLLKDFGSIQCPEFTDEDYRRLEKGALTTILLDRLLGAAYVGGAVGIHIKRGVYDVEYNLIAFYNKTEIPIERSNKLCPPPSCFLCDPSTSQRLRIKPFDINSKKITLAEWELPDLPSLEEAFKFMYGLKISYNTEPTKPRKHHDLSNIIANTKVKSFVSRISTYGESPLYNYKIYVSDN